MYFKNIDYDKLESDAKNRVEADVLYNKRRLSHIDFLNEKSINPHMGNDTIVGDKWYYNHTYLECCHYSQNLMLRLAQLFDPSRRWQIMLTENHDFVYDPDTKQIFDLQAAKISAVNTAIGKQLSVDEASHIAIYKDGEKDLDYAVALEPGMFLHPDFTVVLFKRLLSVCGERMAYYYLYENTIDKFFSKNDYLPAKYCKPFPKDLNYAINYATQTL
jgi:hypothetical protein